MNFRFLLRNAPILGCFLAASCGLSQALPPMPPDIDANFWGRPNQPYTLRLTQTVTSVDRNNETHTRVSEMNVCRDSAGRVRSEDFYDDGSPMTVWVRNPSDNSMTGMTVVTKRAVIWFVPRPSPPAPGKGWTVERLPPRILDGLQVEGFRFTRAVPTHPDGSEPDITTEEDWVSNTLGVVLEQRVESQRTGTRTRTVEHLTQAEPDPNLFTIPSDYSIRDGGDGSPKPINP